MITLRNYKMFYFFIIFFYYFIFRTPGGKPHSGAAQEGAQHPGTQLHRDSSSIPEHLRVGWGLWGHPGGGGLSSTHGCGQGPRGPRAPRAALGAKTGRGAVTSATRKAATRK